jgi:NADP-dependent aldehyde dehydrogenase
MSATLHAVDPRTGEPGPEIPESTAQELDSVIAAAARAARDPRLAEAGLRAAMLRGSAQRLRARHTEVVALASRETGLPEARLTGELERTAVQLEMLADVIVAGEHLDRSQLIEALRSLGGQLAISIHSEPADAEWVRSILPECAASAGRIVFDGFSTGVSVCWAMMHGGPYPASSNAAATSVGMTAIQRFLRPVAFQNAPAALLPPALRDENPLNLRRRVDGVSG